MLCRWSVALGAVFLMAVPGHSQSAIKDAYDRSALFLPWNKPNMILDDDVQASWIGASHLLIYKVAAGKGWRFMVVDADSGVRREAFDHRRLASALGGKMGAPIDADRLPLSELAFPTGVAGPVQFTIAGQPYDCDISAARCSEAPARAQSSRLAIPPAGGRQAVFLRDGDLWTYETGTGAERRLTKDGSPHRAYAAIGGAGFPISRLRRGTPSLPVGSFSPDGTKFLTVMLDEREAPDATLVEHVPQTSPKRPNVITFRPSYPGGPHATATLYLFDLLSGAAHQVEHPPTIPGQLGPIALAHVHWSRDSRFVYFVDYKDLFHEQSLFRTEVATGRTTSLITERSATSLYGYALPDWKLLPDGTIVWLSDRSGWRHMYRYRPDGTLRNPVTRGAWTVRDIVDVDDASGEITFTASGREGGDPYLRRVYRTGLDGRGLKLLTAEPTDHEVRIGRPQRIGPLQEDISSAFSADRSLFIDVHSRVDVPTKTVVRRRDGTVALVLATASRASGVPAYPLPEPFQTTASDGKTPISGVILKPTNFDPSKRYPIIDSMYGGPQSVYTPKTFGAEIGGHYGRGLAELGAVVVIVDGRGTPQRSRAFQDAGYGQLAKAGFLEDHVAAIRELAATRPWMDLSRIGAFGYSAGGFAVVHALFDYPAFYKVGVASSTYDPMLTNWTWAATFQGVADDQGLASAASYRNAAQFNGKLLLLQGDVDDVAEPSGTMRVADALIRNNKIFDMILVPGGGHNITTESYELRKQWDFFAANLIGVAPPADYRFRIPGEKP